MQVKTVQLFTLLTHKKNNMHPIEKIAITLRHSYYLENTEGFWNAVRPWYTRLLAKLGQRGLKRVINGTDPIRLVHNLYQLSETYERDVWAAVMKEVKAGDTVIDIGASVGLYTIAIGLRVGQQGAVHAFEPDPSSFESLQGNVIVNQLTQTVHTYPYAVGDHTGIINFSTGHGVESSVSNTAQVDATKIRLVTLAEMFPQERIDLLKIDVEGFEEQVLQGADAILQDKSRAPRTIFIEVHPFAWGKFGTSDVSILNLLSNHGYQIYDLAGNEVQRITAYGEIIAHQSQKIGHTTA